MVTIDTEQSIIARIIEEHSVDSSNMLDYIGCFVYEGYFIPCDLLLETELEQEIYNKMSGKRHDNVHKDAEEAKIIIIFGLIIFCVIVYVLS